MQKRIAYLLGVYPRWSETFLRQDLGLLLESDLPLLPLCLFRGESPVEGDWPQVHCLSPGPRSQHRSRAAAGRQAAPAPSARSPLVPTTLRTRLSLWRHRRLLETLCRTARSEGISHIHGEFADLPGLMAAAASRRLGCTYSIGVHARDVYTCKYSLKSLFSGIRFATACNVEVRDELLVRCPSLSDRLHLIHHGVLLDQWPFIDRTYEPREPFRILFVGRFVEKKGIEYLLRAVAGTDGARMALSLVGSGPREAKLRGLAQALQIAERTTWVGVVSREEVGARLRAADCVVVPSVVSADGDRDGIPNIVLEAMATGIPVLATRAGSIPEAVSEDTGWVCQARDPEDLRRQLIAVRENPQLAEKKRRTARTLVESAFAARRLASRRAELLRETIADGRQESNSGQ